MPVKHSDITLRIPSYFTAFLALTINLIQFTPMFSRRPHDATFLLTKISTGTSAILGNNVDDLTPWSLKANYVN
jgi:hypothetical protein